MTTQGYGTSTGSDSGGVTGKAQQTAGTAAEEGRHVADVATEEARGVASEAAQHAGDLLQEARTQLEEQSRTQLDRLVGTLKQLADDLEHMAKGEGTGSGVAQTLVTEVSDRARAIGSQIEGRQPGEVLDQVRTFARRRPGTFLLGALAAGVVAGRLTRATKDAASDAQGTTATSGLGTEGLPSSGPGLTDPVQSTGTAADAPLAGTGSPQDDPVYPEGSSLGGPS